MSKKKPVASLELGVLTEAETAEVLASAPAGIAPRTADNPAGLLTQAETVKRITEDLRAIPVPPVVLPVGKRGDKGFVWELNPLWTERVERMAAIAGLTPQSYLESLLRRAWVGMDQRHRGRI